MKKFFKVAVIILLVTSLSVFVFGVDKTTITKKLGLGIEDVASEELGANPSKITINEENIKDKRAGISELIKIKEEEVFIPVRLVLENLGASIRWEKETDTARVSMGDFILELVIDDNIINMGSDKITWEKAPFVSEKRVYAPAETILDEIGASMKWQEENKTLKIDTPEVFDPWDDKDKDKEDAPLLNVAYPPQENHSIYGSPVYVFGTTRSYSRISVTVNDKPVERHDRRTGNFLTTVEVPRGEELDIEIEARDPGGRTTAVNKSLSHPEPWQDMPQDPLSIHSVHLKPDRDQVLTAGDTLYVMIQASPRKEANFWIGDKNSSRSGDGIQGEKIKMTEMKDPPWPVDGGIYRGTYTIKEEDVSASGKTDFLPITVGISKDDQETTRNLPGKVAFHSGPPYKIVEVIDETALGFSGWLRVLNTDVTLPHAYNRGGTVHPAEVKGYLTENTRFEVAGGSGNYYRVELIEDETLLLHRDAVREIDEIDAISGTLSDMDLINKVEAEDKLELRLGIGERLPFLVNEKADEIELSLFGIDYDSKDKEITKEMANGIKNKAPGIIEDLKLEYDGERKDFLTVTLKLEDRMAGYECRFENKELVLKINLPPQVDEARPLEDKTIIVDPGHGGDDLGAGGPGDRHEKDIALELSFLLRDKLEKEGAEVIMTRIEDKNIDLYGRTDPVKDYGGDFFISVHANAHPHGAKAVDTHGIMTLYNHAHSENPAEIILDNMTEKTGLPSLDTRKRYIAILRDPYVPSVLVEAGYMMHPEDNWYILHSSGQEKFAEAMKEGIKEYFLGY